MVHHFYTSDTPLLEGSLTYDLTCLASNNYELKFK